MTEEKKETKGWYYSWMDLEISGIYTTGRHLLDMSLVFIVINYLLQWFINFDGSVKGNNFFIYGFIIAVLLITISLCEKRLGEVLK